MSAPTLFISMNVLFSEPPTVTLRLSVRGDTIKVMAGQPVNMPADVTGLPMPKIEWSKNEVVIDKTSDALKITKKEVSRTEAKTELSMPAVVRNDKGTYTVTASNRLGTAYRNVHVEVFGKYVICCLDDQSFHHLFLLYHHDIEIGFIQIVLLHQETLLLVILKLNRAF